MSRNNRVRKINRNTNDNMYTLDKRLAYCVLYDGKVISGVINKQGRKLSFTRTMYQKMSTAERKLETIKQVAALSKANLKKLEIGVVELTDTFTY